MKDIVYDMACYSITGFTTNNTVADFYYPENFNKLVSRTCFENASIQYVIEKIYSHKQGTINSCGYYNPAEDTGNWVDQLLIRLEEERIAEEISQMEEDLENGDIVPEIDYAEEIEKVLSEEIPVKEITNNKEVLSFMEYSNEIFIPQKTAEGYLIIHSAGENTTRYFYDENYRVNTRESWKISGAANAELKQTETFEYNEETALISKKIITTKNTENILVYNDESLVSENYRYVIHEDKKYLISKALIKYNEDKKVIEDVTRTFTYNSDYTKRTDSFTKKYTYVYNEDEEIPPDFEYFEEGVLKMRNKYSIEKGTYTSQIFFEGGLAVKTYYEDSIRVKDVYTKNDEVIRVKEYEN